MTADAKTQLELGDHVAIATREHPWYGFSGEIADTFSAALTPDLEWVVRLDAAGIGEHTCVCASTDLRRLEDLTLRSARAPRGGR